MDKKEIAELFIEAHIEGNIYNFGRNYIQCTSNCTNCAAKLACRQLSELDGYSSFNILYENIIYQEIKHILGDKFGSI